MNSELNILALDSAYGELSACIVKAGEPFITQPDISADGKTRSTSIVPILEQLLNEASLKWQEIDLLAFGAGPGSFTGLRIAAASLAGLNSGLKLPILHLSSLAITARQCISSEPLWVIEDARAGEAFAGRYEAGECVVEDRCLSWDEVSLIETGIYCCHNEPATALESWQRLPLRAIRSAALLAATEAAVDGVKLDQLPCYPDPIYLQRTQAEKNRDG